MSIVGKSRQRHRCETVLLHKKKMKKQIRIVKKGEDEGNLIYWLSLTNKERMTELEKIRKQINKRIYGTRQGFQRIYRITQRT